MSLRPQPAGHAWCGVHLLSNVKRCTSCGWWRHEDASTGRVGVGPSLELACRRAEAAHAEVVERCGHNVTTAETCGARHCDACGAEVEA